MNNETEFLSVLCAGWPRSERDIGLDANAVFVGNKIGLAEKQARAVVKSLVAKELLTSREVEGTLLVHPTKAALERHRAGRKSLTRHIFGLLFPDRKSGRQGRKA